MKTGPPSAPGGAPATTAPRLAIGSVAVSGIDARAAGRLGAAIERAVDEASRSGALSPAGRPSLHLDLPHGANERDIAAALVRALGRR
ncbi:hypothetical protein SAMN02745157_3296 [Kaistia soli DSM 19436]|uniref:Uncharacterized protein n=1 Tax=Kaistia soli DSM 19436 TaxID=1122133 RepID=A0A1M5G768_9HYPH|nr:hypothetical protein [Kaistia soli]SHF99311.1 hypothetical protein SAMN02745157_3296 [Kaistia soli DSM 19436]